MGSNAAAHHWWAGPRRRLAFVSRITAWAGRGFTRAVNFSRSSFVASGVGGSATLSETAEVLGIPADTVKSYCYYALRALRLALQEQGGEP